MCLDLATAADILINFFLLLQDMNKGEIMRPHIKLRAILAALFVIGSFSFLFSSSVGGSDTFQITKDPYNQYNPAIYQDIVVWEDSRNGNYDIYGCNLSTREEFPICTDPHDQLNPVVYGDTVVWEDSRNGNQDIYGYNISTQKEFPVTQNPSYQYNPAIYGNIVVWEDKRNFNAGSWENIDIYGYNLSTGQEFSICTDLEKQYSPELYDDTIIWIDERNFSTDIYGYTLSTQKEFQITSGYTIGWPYPVIYKDTIVWGVTYFGTRVIEGYDLSELRKFRIFRDFVWQCKPESMKGTKVALYGDIVVWTDYKDCNRDIHGYNLSTHKEFSIAFGFDGEYSPVIFKDTVIWIDDKDGKTDIYGCNLPSGFDLFLDYRMKVILLCLFCGILVALPTLGSVCIGAYAKRKITERMTSEKPRDFRRRNTPSILYAIFAVLSYLYGLYDIIYDVNGVRIISSAAIQILPGFFWIILSGSLLYLAVWSKRTPYVRTTDDEITIFRGRMSKEVIKWGNIQHIDFKDNQVDLICSSDKRVTIFLNNVHKRDKKDLIQILNEFSSEGSPSP